MDQKHMSKHQKNIQNNVAKSGLITLDLQDWFSDVEIAGFDLKDYLHMELILREKEFRASLEKINWADYSGKIIAVFCSTDAIIASWAYMLVAAHARDFALDVVYGEPAQLAFEKFRKKMDETDWSRYSGKRVLLKGCSSMELPPSAYLYAAQKLLPYAERLMYGEACSFVPVYRAGAMHQLD